MTRPGLFPTYLALMPIALVSLAPWVILFWETFR